MKETGNTVLIVDAATGRRAALAAAYLKSPYVSTVLLIGGNDSLVYPGEKTVQSYGSIGPKNTEMIVTLAQMKEPDLIDVAQDDAVALNTAGILREKFTVLGPDAKAGRLESSKGWSRVFGYRYLGPHYTPEFKIFEDQQSGLAYLETFPKEKGLVIKADGLAEGKGVRVVANVDEAREAIEWVQKFGSTYLIEQKVGGPNAQEFSGFFLGSNQSGNQRFQEVGYAQDHKRLEEGDRGPNTGGMGCVNRVSFIGERLRDRIKREIIDPTAKGFESEKVDYTGILYLGGMYDPDLDKLWVIEFNSRWGDPEAEVLVPGITSDFFELAMHAATGGERYTGKLEVDNIARVSVVAASVGYPIDNSWVNQAPKRPIQGLSEVLSVGEVRAYGAGVKKGQDGLYYPAGGRILHLVGEGSTVAEARAKANQEMAKLYIAGDNGENLIHHRSDIGLKQE